MYFKILFFFFWITTTAAQITVTGVVLNAKDKSAVPFASIKAKQSGVYSNADGRFSIVIKSPDTLVCSSVGFEKKMIIVNAKTKNIIIFLTEKANAIDEVMVRPDENPAWPIIRKVLKNRNLNDPNQFDSYRANAYTKIFVMADSIQFTVKDTTTDTKRRFVANVPLFLLENYSEVIHKKPNKNKETVTASVNSLLQFYSQLANSIPFDIHKMAFYEELYNFVPLERFYVNPINAQAFSQYDFVITDSLYQAADTTFVLSFRPYPHAKFNGLMGTVHINSDGYAIQKISVAPVDTLQYLRFQINQKYEKVGTKWFPKNTETLLRSNRTSNKAKATGSMKFSTVYTNIETDIPLKDSLFDEAQRVFLPSASRYTQEKFKAYRTDSLSDKEKIPYKLMQTNKMIKRFHKLDSAYGHLVGSLAAGVFEVGKIDIIPQDFFSFNSVEGLKFGAGIQNNQRLKPRFGLYGFAGYGTRDERFKYSLVGSWNISRDRYNRLSVFYKNTVNQPGIISFLRPNFLVESEASLPIQLMRDTLKVRADYYRSYGVSAHFKPFAWNWFRLTLSHEQRAPNYDYSFKDKTIFNNTELTLDWRLAYKEALYRTGRIESVVNRFYPIISAKISKGLQQWGGEFDCWKVTAEISYQIRTKRMGFTNIRATGGLVLGNVPMSYLYGSFGGLGQVGQSINTFKTLSNYSFLADRYTAVYLNHDFNKTLFTLKTKYSQPRIIIFNNVLMGKLQNTDNHRFSWSFLPSKLHLEAGIEVRDLIRIPISALYLGIGGGLAYNYSPDRSTNWKQNLSPYFLGVRLSQ